MSDDHPAPLRVVLEPRLGSNLARERGLREARYELVSFIDDDNWVNENWVSTVSHDVHSTGYWCSWRADLSDLRDGPTALV